MTAAMKKRVETALGERGLSIDAFCDNPDEMTNDEARSLLRMLSKMFRPATECLIDLDKLNQTDDEDDEDEGRCLD